MAKKSKVIDFSEVPETLNDNPFYGLELDEEQKVFRDMIWSKDKIIIFCNANAGTGKKTIATGVADLHQFSLYGRKTGIFKGFFGRKVFPIRRTFL